MSIRLLVLVLAILPAMAHAAAPVLEGAIRLPDQSVPRGKSVDVTLPALPAQAGKVTVLSFRALIVSAGPGGCNWNMSAQVNGRALSRHTPDNLERLVGRPPALELKDARQGFPVFSGPKLMTMYARDADEADAMTTDGLGGTFALDVTDLVRGVDGNSATFSNLLPLEMPAGMGGLAVTDIQVGYLDRSKLPPIPSQAPTRGPISGGVSAGKLRLAQSCSGGFSLRYGDGPELLVETALMVKPALPELIAEDNDNRSDALRLKCYAAVGHSYDMQAIWSGLKLERTLRLDQGLLRWREKWTNTGEKLLGVPFTHRFFLRQKSTRFYLGGSPDNCSLVCSASNPTLYLEPAGSGEGFGVTAESDWLRLLAGWRGMSDLGELYSNQLALEPGKSIEFDYTVTPVSDGGGYWSFVNGVRQRWGVNGTTMPAPLFWGFSNATGGTAEENIRKALGHLGPAIITIGPWQRLEPDARTVTARRYPKLPADAPPTPGRTPDLDVDAFLTFAHREPYWKQVKDLTALIHANCPGVKVIEMIHPAMETVYLPLQDKWPIAPDAIKTQQGATFNDSHYTRSWVGDMADKDWAVLYYCPHENGPQLKAILDGIRRGMDECGLDGIYSDEFSYAFGNRGYSRYDYSRKDGYSADLDENGQVTRQKADNAWMSRGAQVTILEEVSQRNKFFLGNGGNVLEATWKLPHHRFIEGGNGPSRWGQGHLSAVPLVLGNMGDEKTTRGVFESVKLCLEHGTIYSPMAVNQLLEGSDNFVSKLYPLTIVRLGPGYVVGRERIITSVTRSFDWPGVSGRVKLYRYNAEGTRIDAEADVTVKRGEPLSLMVPEGGLVIAER